MLLEAAVGDAYGAGFEYADRSVIQAHNDLIGNYEAYEQAESRRPGE